MGGYNSEFQKPISGTITAVSQTIDLSSPNQTVETIQLTGTWVGTLVVEGSNDGTTFIAVPIVETSTNLISNNITANGIFIGQTNAYQYIQIRSSAWTSGTATVTVYGSDAASLVSSIGYLRGGTDGTIIGNIGDTSKTSSILIDSVDPTRKASVSINNDVGVQDGLSDGGVYGNLALTTGGTTYEAKVGGSRLAYRKSLVITALDDMYWGYSSSVTTSTGTPLYKNQQIIFSIDPDSTFQVWLVASGSSKNARITESP